MFRRSKLILCLAGVAAAVLLASCGGTSASDKTATAGGGGAKLNVVAAENFWASLASQLGGDRVNVKAIITSPDTDPHDYEATPGDARDLADAKYVIYNGVGYDPWADQALSANPASGRKTLKVQELARAV